MKQEVPPISEDIARLTASEEAPPAETRLPPDKLYLGKEVRRELARSWRYGYWLEKVKDQSLSYKLHLKGPLESQFLAAKRLGILLREDGFEDVTIMAWTITDEKALLIEGRNVALITEIFEAVPEIRASLEIQRGFTHLHKTPPHASMLEELERERKKLNFATLRQRLVHLNER